MDKNAGLCLYMCSSAGHSYPLFEDTKRTSKRYFTLTGGIAAKDCENGKDPGKGVDVNIMGPVKSTISSLVFGTLLRSFC